jgi:hypothetical protein
MEHRVILQCNFRISFLSLLSFPVLQKCAIEIWDFFFTSQFLYAALLFILSRMTTVHVIFVIHIFPPRCWLNLQNFHLHDQLASVEMIKQFREVSTRRLLHVRTSWGVVNCLLLSFFVCFECIYIFIFQLTVLEWRGWRKHVLDSCFWLNVTLKGKRLRWECWHKTCIKKNSMLKAFFLFYDEAIPFIVLFIFVTQCAKRSFKSPSTP